MLIIHEGVHHSAFRNSAKCKTDKLLTPKYHKHHRSCWHIDWSHSTKSKMHCSHHSDSVAECSQVKRNGLRHALDDSRNPPRSVFGRGRNLMTLTPWKSLYSQTQ